jgi:hypothetical protein
MHKMSWAKTLLLKSGPVLSRQSARDRLSHGSPLGIDCRTVVSAGINPGAGTTHDGSGVGIRAGGVVSPPITLVLPLSKPSRRPDD